MRLPENKRRGPAAIVQRIAAESNSEIPGARRGLRAICSSVCSGAPNPFFCVSCGGVAKNGAPRAAFSPEPCAESPERYCQRDICLDRDIGAGIQ